MTRSILVAPKAELSITCLKIEMGFIVSFLHPLTKHRSSTLTCVLQELSYVG